MTTSTPSESVVAKSNMIGTVGFVLSLVALVLSCGLLSPISLIVSLFGLTKQPKGMAIAGVIISIIGFLVGGGIFIFFGAALLAAVGIAAGVAVNAPTWNAQSEMDQIATAIDSYQTINGELPPSLDDAGDLISVDALTDFWGYAYIYEPADDGTYELRSTGPDGLDGTGDDIIYDPDAEFEGDGFTFEGEGIEFEMEGFGEPPAGTEPDTDPAP